MLELLRNFYQNHIEKWYVLFMMRIARHNKMRMKFEEKYDDIFDDYGQEITYMTLKKCHEKGKSLYAIREDGSEYKVATRPQRDDFGLYEYVDQHSGYCEDDYYGTIYTKTPIKRMWLKRSYHC